MTTSKPQTLREIRDARKLTIQDVSRLAGVDPRQLERWEAGKAEIDPGRIDRLAEAFGIPISQIPLEQNRRHYANSGWIFILRTDSQLDDGGTRRGYRARVDMELAGDRWFSEDDPQYPSFLEVTGPTREEALDALVVKLDEAFTHLPPSPSDEEVAAFLAQHDIRPTANGEFDRNELLREITGRGWSCRFGSNVFGNGVEATHKKRPGLSFSLSNDDGNTANDVAYLLYKIIKHEQEN